MFSLVIPLFNEEENLPELYRRIAAAAPEWGSDWELILVDDGSSDRTWELARELHNKDSRVRALRLACNFGHQLAVSAGLRNVRGDVVAVLDADLQDPPEELGRFFAEFERGFDVVYAVRRKRAAGRNDTDFSLPPRPLNRLLTRLVSGETRHIANALDTGARAYRRGVSLVAVLQRVGATS